MTKDRILLGALKHRNFRLFFFGQSISLIGTWMQQVAMIWLVYRLSNSAFLLGLVGFCSQIPSFFLAPVAGVFTDRWNLHRTILLTQSLAMCQAMILAVLTLTGTVAVWHVLALSVCMGLDHRLRHARPAGLSDPDGGRTRESDQRHRPELVDVQRGTTGWAGDCRFSDRGGGGRSLLPAERAELCGRVGGPAGHAAAAASTGQAAAARPPRTDRRIPLCLWLSSDPRNPHASGPGEHGGHAA